MKSLLVLALFFALYGNADARVSVIAASDSVILKPNGSWEFAPKDPIEIQINEEKTVLLFDNGTWEYKKDISKGTEHDSVPLDKAIQPLDPAQLTSTNSSESTPKVDSPSLSNEQPRSLSQSNSDTAKNMSSAQKVPDPQINQTSSVNTAQQNSTVKTVKGNRVDYLISFDTTKWKIDNSEVGEYSFELLGKNAFAMMIAGRKKMSLENLEAIAVANAKSQAPNLKVVSRDQKKINGKDVLSIQMDGNIEGIPFTFYGYLYAGENAALQFMSYTVSKMFSEYKPDMESLLSGMVIAEK
ncbi:hypothetical protein CHS0354_024181 [Potamilus streckersoni]|uniref:Uncharacterized protein n=1 Tax=Potamilus streckersoni TaxID=2493646 RepID=A0AAE0RZQ0_9BIVA|nr:hypothetical protein CHS0354_024181 [Potamilus streckersoni]